MKELQIFTTGGVIDKVYFDQKTGIIKACIEN